MCRGPPAPGELPGPDSAPYSQAYLDVRSIDFTNVPSTNMSKVELMPPPPALSGMENRVTRLLVGWLVVNSTDAPVWPSVTALRPDASPARSPIVRLGPTSCAPPASTPFSASTDSYGMFAPRPTNRAVVLVLLPCLIGSSLPSLAITVRTLYRPFAAVH